MSGEKSRYIGEPITVAFDKAPLFSKKPGCPDRFSWQGESYEIEALLKSWHDYRRRGRMADNMQPAHAAMAEKRGSWGVGRFYFRVRTRDGRCFELYYDRAPKDADQRAGAWFLIREVLPGDG